MPSFVEIGSPVLKKKIFEGFLPYIYQLECHNNTEIMLKRFREFVTPTMIIFVKPIFSKDNVIQTTCIFSDHAHNTWKVSKEELCKQCTQSLFKVSKCLNNY